MTIAGSDSGGGAGIEADLRTFAAHRVHGTVAITALTAQSTVGVTAVTPIEAEMVAAQITTVLDDMKVMAAKTGMLCRPATIERLGAMADAGVLPPLVVDPVLVSSTGHPLMEAGGAVAYRSMLIPAATVVTPNLREAAVLLGVEVGDLSTVVAMADAGRALVSLGATWAVVKGGHLLDGGDTESAAPDVLVGPTGVTELEGTRVATTNDHGTGCSMAAAITANLANGLNVSEAVVEAKAFVHQALSGAVGWRLGAGHGPIDHLGWGPLPSLDL